MMAHDNPAINVAGRIVWLETRNLRVSLGFVGYSELYATAGF
jgi:hypothetical protein